MDVAGRPRAARPGTERLHLDGLGWLVMVALLGALLVSGWLPSWAGRGAPAGPEPTVSASVGPTFTTTVAVSLPPARSSRSHGVPRAPRVPAPPVPSASASGRSPYAVLADRGGEDCARLVHRDRPIDAIRAAFTARSWRRSMLALLAQRFPDGASVVGQLRDPGFFDAWFVQGKTQWGAAVTELPSAVHETAHVVGLGARRGRHHVLVLGEREQLSFPIPATFQRSAILAELPEAIRALVYSKTYLEGPSGAQGFEMVLDELNAYTYSLLVAVAVADELPGNMRQSARDGLLAFMLYTQIYLRLARTSRPAVYQAIRAGAIGRATVRLYDRAECAVGRSASDDNLGIDDALLWGELTREGFVDEVAPLGK